MGKSYNAVLFCVLKMFFLNKVWILTVLSTEMDPERWTALDIYIG